MKRTAFLAMLEIALLGAAPPPRATILIYSGSTGFRHDSIPVAVAAVEKLARQRGLAVAKSENPAIFTSKGLKKFRAVVLVSTTTDPKKPDSEWFVGDRRDAFRAYVEGGGGVMAIHAAADSHYYWPWYARMIGGKFARHPAGTPRGEVTIVAPRGPVARGLAAKVRRTDEWYYYDDYDPTSSLVATLDPASIGEADVNPNPVAWTRRVGKGRVFYSAMGHTTESYSEPWFLALLGNGLDWTTARRP